MVSRVIRAGVVAASLLVAPLASAQSAAGPDAFFPPVDSLPSWDAAIASLTRMVWSVHDAADATSKDRSGRTRQDYFNEHVLDRKTKQRIDELRALAGRQSDAGDEEGLKRTLSEGAPLISAELHKALGVVLYWEIQESVADHVGILKPWVDRASAEDQKTIADRVASTYDVLGEHFSELLQARAGTATAIRKMTTAAFSDVAHLNQERDRFVTKQADLPNPNALPPRERTAECPAPSVPASDQGGPGLGQGFPSSESFYPQESRRRSVTGSVVVRVSVSGTGCAERVEVERTSGVKALDEAALDLALAGRYTPAAEDGKAVPGMFRFLVKFELGEAPGAGSVKDQGTM